MSSFTLKRPNLNIEQKFLFLDLFLRFSLFCFKDSPIASFLHTGPGQSRGEFQLCFNVNVKLFLYFNSTLLIFFPPRISLFTVHSAFDLCRRKIQNSNRYWSAVDCHLELHVCNNHCVDSNHSLFPFDSLEFRCWLFICAENGMVSFSSFPSFVWSEGSNDIVAQ